MIEVALQDSSWEMMEGWVVDCERRCLWMKDTYKRAHGKLIGIFYTHGGLGQSRDGECT